MPRWKPRSRRSGIVLVPHARSSTRSASCRVLGGSARTTSPYPASWTTSDSTLRLRRGVRIAIGEPAHGIGGFRQSHEEAVQARRVAELAARPSGTITRYVRVALPAIATADLDQARTFVQRELGGLVADDDVTARLTATLRTYLDEHSSRSRTAKRLGVHENTVSYRIKQAEEILGRGVDQRTLELRVALALANLVRDRTD